MLCAPRPEDKEKTRRRFDLREVSVMSVEECSGPSTSRPNATARRSSRFLGFGYDQPGTYGRSVHTSAERKFCRPRSKSIRSAALPPDRAAPPCSPARSRRTVRRPPTRRRPAPRPTWAPASAAMGTPGARCSEIIQPNTMPSNPPSNVSTRLRSGTAGRYRSGARRSLCGCRSRACAP